MNTSGTKTPNSDEGSESPPIDRYIIDERAALRPEELVQQRLLYLLGSVAIPASHMPRIIGSGRRPM